jgi:hypothetical protein
MRYLLCIIYIISSLTPLFSQEPVFNKGSKVLDLGVGIGSDIYSRYHYQSGLPLLSTSLEVGVKDGVIGKGTIGVGCYFGYTTYKENITNWGYNYKNTIIGARGAFHYPLANKLDTYTGIVLGINISSAKEYGSDSGKNISATSGGPVYSWFIGGRYYFTEIFGVMAELGVGITYLNTGVAFKF